MLKFLNKTPTLHKKMSTFVRAMAQNHKKIDANTTKRSTHYNTHRGKSYALHTNQENKISRTTNFFDETSTYAHLVNKCGAWINA